MFRNAPKRGVLLVLPKEPQGGDRGGTKQRGVKWILHNLQVLKLLRALRVLAGQNEVRAARLLHAAGRGLHPARVEPCGARPLRRAPAGETESRAGHARLIARLNRSDQAER